VSDGCTRPPQGALLVWWIDALSSPGMERRQRAQFAHSQQPPPPLSD